MSKAAATALSSVPGFADPETVSQQPHEAIIIDFYGHSQETSGSIWVLHHPTKPVNLDWADVEWASTALIDATQTYFRWLIKTYSMAEVQNNWYGVRFILDTPALLQACADGEAIPYAAFSEAMARTTPDNRYRLTYVRKWYQWCADQGFALFSPEVALELDAVVIGANRKGEAVQSSDPSQGPLSDTEVVALSNRLRAAKIDGSLSLQKQAVLWLCLALGSNTGQLALMWESDFRRIDTDDVEGVAYEIDVPRHKKRQEDVRGSVRTRKLTREIGEIVEALIVENRQSGDTTEAFTFYKPLFRRRDSRLASDSPIQAYGHHYTGTEISALVKDAVRKLAVISPRTGMPLHATPRRFRYTFATRLVREGASQRAVAHALDHSDLQSVKVYFDLKSDIVEKLDEAMALALGPLAQAFLGHLVRSEADAVRGDRRSSRIYHGDAANKTLDALGTCGSFGFCGLTAPIACYTCVRFQPWIEAPHDQVLKSLLDERQRREDTGLDAKIVGLFDVTILAVGEVIRRIDDILEREPANAR